MSLRNAGFAQRIPTLCEKLRNPSLVRSLCHVLYCCKNIAVQSDCRTANYNIPVKSHGLIRVLWHTEGMERVHVSFEAQKREVRDATRSAAKELGYHDLKQPEQLAVCSVFAVLPTGYGKSFACVFLTNCKSSSDSFDSDHEHTQFNVIIFIVGYVTANIPAVQNVI